MMHYLMDLLCFLFIYFHRLRGNKIERPLIIKNSEWLELTDRVFAHRLSINATRSLNYKRKERIRRGADRNQNSYESYGHTDMDLLENYCSSDEEQEEVKTPRKLKSYTTEFKLKVIKHAQEFSNHSASSSFGVDRKTVRLWKNQEGSLNRIKTASLIGKFKKRLCGGGRPIKFKDLDDQLAIWIRERRSKKLRVSRSIIQSHAKICFHAEEDVEKFKLKRRDKASHSRNGNAYSASQTFNHDDQPGLFNKQVITGIPDLSDPCFRRYTNSIIVNAQPYERRSSISLVNCKAQCLRSQIGTYSCRSFVYDNINQVCDLFAHVGDQSPARLLRFQSRDYFEPTAALSCHPPDVNNIENYSRQLAPSTFGATNHDSNSFVSSSFLSSKVNENIYKNGSSEIEKSDVPIRAFSESTSEIILSCDNSQLPRFLKTVDFELYAHDDARVSNVNLDECLDLCVSNVASKASALNNAVKCNSFEYDNHKKECVLSIETAVPLGNGQLRQRTGTDYYEKLCVDEKLAIECGTQIYARYPQMILVGFAETVVDAPTLQHCFDNCLNSRRLYGFRCVSGMFYFEEPQLNCILNTEDRKSQPDLFTVENSDLVDYFETLCDARESMPNPKLQIGKQFIGAVTTHQVSSPNYFSNRDFVDKNNFDEQNSFVYDDMRAHETMTVPVSTAIDTLPSAKLTIIPSPDNLRNDESIVVESSWSTWAPCETPQDILSSIGVNGAVIIRGTQTRRKLCGVSEQICGKETRQCDVTINSDSPNRSRHVMSTQPTVNRNTSREKMAEALRGAHCVDGKCCAVFGGCRVGIRRIPQSSERLEWCVDPCADEAV